MRTASGDYGLLAPDEDHAEAHQPGPQPHPHAHAHARARDPDRDAADQPAGPGYGGGGGGFGSFADRGHSGSGDFGAAWNSARSAKGQTQLQDTFLGEGPPAHSLGCHWRRQIGPCDGSEPS